MEKAGKQNKYHYNPALKDRANALRKSMTKAEACLWKYTLSRRQMYGFTFNRQRPVLDYIADFMCKELLLIIEVDGISHESHSAQSYDLKRQRRLEQIGFTVLRFSNWEVLNAIDDVAIMIGDWIKAQGKEASIRPRDQQKKERG